MKPTEPHAWDATYRLVQDVLLADTRVRNGAVYPRWVSATHFWYERSRDGAPEFRVVDAGSGLTVLTIARDDIVDALSSSIGTRVDADACLFTGFAIEPDLSAATFSVFGEFWRYSIGSGSLSQPLRTQDRDWLVSPDESQAIFSRDHNLWVRVIASGEERALTFDGEPNNVYGARPQSTRDTWATIGAKPEACWSPDSLRILTAQTDDRHVAEIPYMEFAPEGSVRPKVCNDRYSLPGDERVGEHRMLCIDVRSGRHTPADYRRLPVVRTYDTPCSAGLCWWSADSRFAWFVDIERGEGAVHVIHLDVATGSTRQVFSETSETYIDLSVNIYTPALLLPLPETNELVWYSERTGHGHLYLYDLDTGVCKNAITSGAWQVRDTYQVDATRREVFFLAAGISPGEDPYICKPCVASLGGADVRVVSAERGEHVVWHPSDWGLLESGLLGLDLQRISGLSPTGEFFVETVGSVDRLPHTVLRHRSGAQIAELEVASAELPAAWKWPHAVALTAADGVTTTYGLLFEPLHYDPSTSYPVIDFIYGGPQLPWVPKCVFASDSNDVYLTAASFAALGAFALILDGRGTAFRERAFRVASHGQMQTASNLEDHIAGIKQLAASVPGLDAERVAITGFSGGGYMAAMAALRFGDFFKVAVAGGGDYDNRLFWNSWAERFHGPYDERSYDAQAAKTYAAGLCGKLLFIHGMLDSGVHPAALFQLLQALIEANKDADLLLLPRSAHSMTSYGERRRLDYFVEHLFQGSPPKDVKLSGFSDSLERRGAYSKRRPDALRAMPR